MQESVTPVKCFIRTESGDVVECRALERQGTSDRLMDATMCASIECRLEGGRARLLITPAQKELARGGLSAWQQKKLANHIEAHLAEELTIVEMAGLVDLSPFHFARAFKQSFGVPPHRYHVGRRMARAKSLLPERSVTEVALAVGFAETSSFSAAFRKNTGQTPSEYRRGWRVNSANENPRHGAGGSGVAGAGDYQRVWRQTGDL